MENRKPKQMASSFLGCLAIFFWGSTIAFSRSLTEQIGTFTAAASIFLLSGILSCLCLALSRRARAAFTRLPWIYLIGCGFFFVVYMAGLYLAIGLTRNREQVIEVGLVNYLWPSLTLVFSIAILGNRARWTLVPGMVIACAGVILVTLHGGQWSWDSFASNVQGNWIPYLSALAAAVSWALYSNFSRRWAGGHEGNGVPVFLLITGCLLAAIRPLFPEDPQWTPGVAGELAYMALFPTLLAYLFWDRAMRRGNVVLVASLSYFTPLLSTAISCLYLDVPMGAALWAGCALVIAGALLCNWSVRPGAS